MQKTYAVEPTSGSAQLRIFNTLNCTVPVTIQDEAVILKALDVWENKDIKAKGSVNLNFEANFAECHREGYSDESGVKKGCKLYF